jgi:hypothetical protein
MGVETQKKKLLRSLLKGTEITNLPNNLDYEQAHHHSPRTKARYLLSTLRLGLSVIFFRNACILIC